MIEHQGLQTGFRLDEWLVKPDDGSLVSPQRVTRLEPLLMELLVFLCSRAGQVVSKEDLLKSIWRNRFVSDGTIKANFHRLRKALGECSRKPRIIETLPKRGYRILIQPVAVMECRTLTGHGDGADELCRKGCSILSGQSNPAAVKQARLYLERAIEVHPEHAESVAALAHTYIDLVTLEMAEGSALLPRAKALALRAIEWEPKLARGYAALGITQLLYDRNLVDAERNLSLAGNLDPIDVDALSHRWYSRLLSSSGRHDEAISVARQALRGDPLSLAVRRNLVETLFAARHYEQTIGEANQLMEMTGQAPDIQLGLAWVYFIKGNEGDALHCVCEGFRSLGTRPEMLDGITRSFKSGGMLAVFQFWAEVMEQQAAMGRKSIDLLVLYALLGENDRCFKLLDLAVKHFHPVILSLPVSPVFDKLRSDLRYDRLLAHLGFRGAHDFPTRSLPNGQRQT